VCADDSQLNEAVEFQRCCNDRAMSQQLISFIVTHCIQCKLLTDSYFAPVALQSIVMSMSACVRVCVSVHSTVQPNFTKSFVLVACGCGLVLR